MGGKLAVITIALAALAGVARADDKPGKDATAAGPPLDFIADAKELLIVGACADGTSSKVKPEIVAAHCKTVRAAQDEYKKTWINVAREFFAKLVPATAPKTIVYPFAGGDLASALTVFPDADEITTLSLEPAGDARALGRLDEKQIKASLQQVASELAFLYRASFSRTMNMIDAMRAGKLPTQLIFSLSALWLHGYEPLSLRYFQLDKDGTIVYLTAADLEKIDKVKDVATHNRYFANVELRFRKPGSKHEQVYRHILANLDDAHIKASPAALKHLEKKGTVTGMTKAASYLLSFGDFATIRKYLMDHVTWMVSDTTGVPPEYGKPAGFDYEVWGEWVGANMAAGNGAVANQWRALFKSQPARELPFRFGYPDAKLHGHLVVMKKAPPPK
jgi:hypothetical protein